MHLMIPTKITPDALGQLLATATSTEQAEVLQYFIQDLGVNNKVRHLRMAKILEALPFKTKDFLHAALAMENGE